LAGGGADWSARRHPWGSAAGMLVWMRHSSPRGLSRESSKVVFSVCRRCVPRLAVFARVSPCRCESNVADQLRASLRRATPHSQMGTGHHIISYHSVTGLKAARRQASSTTGKQGARHHLPTPPTRSPTLTSLQMSATKTDLEFVAKCPDTSPLNTGCPSP